MLSLPTNRQLRRQLIELPDLVAEAYNALGMQPGRGLSASRSTNPPGSRPPVNLAVLALLGGPDWDGRPCEPGEEPSVDAVLSYWCAVFSGQACRNVSSATQFLLLIHDDACAHDDAQRYAEQVAWHYRRLRAMVGPIARRPLPCVGCPDCGQVALTDTDAPELRCAACGTYVTREAYAAAAASWYAAGA